MDDYALINQGQKGEPHYTRNSCEALHLQG